MTIWIWGGLIRREEDTGTQTGTQCEDGGTDWRDPPPTSQGTQEPLEGEEARGVPTRGLGDSGTLPAHFRLLPPQL